MERSIHDTLIYVKVALGLFILTSIFVTLAFGTMLLIPYGPRPPAGDAVRAHITPMDIRSSLFVATAPLVVSLLTYVKIAKPLKEGKMPSKPWNLALTILGYVFALVIGGVLLSIAYYKVYS